MLGGIGLQHREQPGDGEEFPQRLFQMNQLELAPPTVKRHVGVDDLGNADAVDKADPLEVQHNSSLTLLHQGIDCVLQAPIPVYGHWAAQVEDRHAANNPFLNLHRHESLEPAEFRHKRGFGSQARGGAARASCNSAASSSVGWR